MNEKAPSWPQRLRARLFPKKHFSWREPKEFRRLVRLEQRKQRKWWMQPAVALLTAMVLLTRWAVGKLDPADSPIALELALPIALFGGGCVAYLFPWLLDLVPRFVTVFDTLISRTLGQSAECWYFKDVLAYEWRANEHFLTLVLMMKKGKKISIGAPISLEQAKIDALLHSRIGVATEH